MSDKPKPKPRRKPKPRPRKKEPEDADSTSPEAISASDSAESKEPAATTPTPGERRPAKRAKERSKKVSPSAPPTKETAPDPQDTPSEQRATVGSTESTPNGAPPEPTGNDGPQDEPEETEGGGSFLFFTAMPSWLTSTIVHVIVLLVLALMTLPAIHRPERDNELVMSDNNELVEDLEEFEDQALDSVEIDPMEEVSDMVLENSEEIMTEDPVVTPAMDLTSAAIKVDLDPLSLASVASSDLGQSIGASGGDAFSGRGAATKARLIRESGGSEASEAAVAAALKWLKNHQMADGGWSLDHKQSRSCQGRCPDIGKKKLARNGATALALLPFLGSGQTHVDGEYKAVVERGLKFLLRRMKTGGGRGSLVEKEGTYYSHGLGAIVICESYAMTQDKTLRDPAQALINEIVFAQDPVGGGWRYTARQPGDTSVVGWQLMALKSAHMGYLNVPKQTIVGTSRFLDTVQTKDGANYGYTDPSKNWRNSTAAVGLLCRMYLGWRKTHPSIEAGVKQLSEKGPSLNDVYYNYYATQVMRHHGGDAWKKWNGKMRDQLVNSQENKDAGHRAGSWYFEGGHANKSGGRLYATAMATMILEVYYRHLPLYQEEASEDEFPL